MAIQIPFKKTYTNSTDPLRIYFNLCIIKYFLDVISTQNDMLDKLLKLMTDFPSIDLAAMGFPQNWQQEPLWQKMNVGF